jgi:CelD/BcsL family acetyltransferase involved in cellulose biosynthesis
VCPFIRLEGQTWDSYLATLGPSHRATVRRRLTGLRKKFDTRFELVTEEGARAQAIEALFAFHEQRWDGRGGSTAFRTPALRAFHRDATQRMLHGGTLRIYALHLNGALAAVMYGFVSDNRFYFYQHGFDARYLPQSIGLVLMGLTIQAAITEGLSEFDMLYGDESYKSLWTSERRPLMRLELFPTHLAGRLQRHSVQAETSVRTFAKRMLAHGS